MVVLCFLCVVFLSDFKVTSKSHVYLPSIRLREEGGTPNIVGAIKAGLVFQLKDKIGEELIDRTHANQR